MPLEKPFRPFKRSTDYLTFKRPVRSTYIILSVLNY